MAFDLQTSSCPFSLKYEKELFSVSTTTPLLPPQQMNKKRCISILCSPADSCLLPSEYNLFVKSCSNDQNILLLFNIFLKKSLYVSISPSFKKMVATIHNPMKISLGNTDKPGGCVAMVTAATRALSGAYNESSQTLQQNSAMTGSCGARSRVFSSPTSVKQLVLLCSLLMCSPVLVFASPKPKAGVFGGVPIIDENGEYLY